MSKVNIKNGCLFSFQPIDVFIGDELIRVKNNQIRTIEVPMGNYTIKAQQFWSSGYEQMNIKTEIASIVIRRRVPEFVRALAIGFLIMVFVLFSFSMISISLTMIATTSIAVLSLLDSIFAKKHYFKIRPA